MADELCLNPRCRSQRHEPTCTEKECATHPARPAADGLRLCAGHAKAISEDATMAAELHAELALNLVGGQGQGDKVSGTPGPRYPDQRAVEARTLIRHTMASWCRLVAEERGVTLPADEVVAMGAFVALHATWLAAQPFAGECSTEVGELAHGLPRRVAYPNGTRVVPVGPCPRTLEDETTCPGTLKAVVRRADSLLPSEVVCDADDTHRWDSTQWRQLDRLVSGRRAA